MSGSRFAGTPGIGLGRAAAWGRWEKAVQKPLATATLLVLGCSALACEPIADGKKSQVPDIPTAIRVAKAAWARMVGRCLPRTPSPGSNPIRRITIGSSGMSTGHCPGRMEG